MATDKEQAAAKRWNERYRSGDTPWDTGLVSRELVKFLDRGIVGGGHAIDLGCGTGTNARELCRRGFQVSAVDCSAVALEQAQRSVEDSESIQFFEADVCCWIPPIPPCDFLFDRGCYHCVRRTDLHGFLRTLQRIAQPGTQLLLLTGNDRQISENGPPTVSPKQIRSEFGAVCDVISIEEFHFEDAGGAQGPLGWSCHLVWRTA